MDSPIVGALVLALLRAGAWLYAIQPLRVQRFWGSALGGLLGLMRLRSRIVDQNLSIAYAGDPARRERLSHSAYTHLGNLIFEILLVLGPKGAMKRYIQRNTDLYGAEHWRQAQALGKGVIFLSSHVGNWEVMAGTGTLGTGLDLMLVTKHLKPEWLHQAIERGRASYGVRATYEPRTLKDVLAQLKKGQTVGFVLDQYAGPPIGVRVPVFGVPVGTTTVIATLARRTGATVLPVVNFRRPDGRWHVEIHPPMAWEPHEDATYELAANTARYAAAMERDILAHPDQWLWIHRRFKGDLGPLRPGEWSEGRVRS